MSNHIEIGKEAVLQGYNTIVCDGKRGEIYNVLLGLAGACPNPRPNRPLITATYCCDGNEFHADNRRYCPISMLYDIEGIIFSVQRNQMRSRI